MQIGRFRWDVRSSFLGRNWFVWYDSRRWIAISRRELKYKRKKRIHYISNVASAKRMQARRLSPSAMHNLYLYTYTCAYRYLRARTNGCDSARETRERNQRNIICLSRKKIQPEYFCRIQDAADYSGFEVSRYRCWESGWSSQCLYPLSLSFA